MTQTETSTLITATTLTQLDTRRLQRAHARKVAYYLETYSIDLHNPRRLERELRAAERNHMPYEPQIIGGQ